MTSIDIAVMVAGMAATIIGCFGKGFEYWSPPGKRGKKAPTWFGRLMFIGVGLVFLLFELKRAFLDMR